MPSRCFQLLLALLVCSGVAAVQDQVPRPVDPEKLWALVIGVSNYTRAEPLKFAASDAQAFSDFLQSPRGGGIPRAHVATLVEDQATRTAILLELGALQEKVQKGDTIYLYLAGHGIMSGRSGYFIPSDGDPRSAVASAVPFVQLKAMIEADLAHAKSRIVITDICHAGRIGARPEALAAKIQNLINEEFQNLRGAGGGFLNLFASRPSEASWEREDLGHGVFTHALLEALNGKAVGPGEGIADARRVVDYVRAEVPKFTAGQQHPVANDDFDPSLPLSFPGRPGPSPRAGAEEAFLEIVNADKTELVRVQWIDPGSQSTAVRQIRRDQGVAKIGPVMPGELELDLFEAGGRPHRVKVKLAAGKNTLDLAGTKLNRIPGPPPGGAQLASLTPILPAAGALRAFAPPALPQPAESRDATLSMRLDGTAQIYVDDTFYGESGGGRAVQLEGLAPGPHTLRLIHTPEREQRFRLKLFAGQQVFDPPSGELRFVVDLHAQALELAPPPDLAVSQRDLYRRFHLAVHEERLVTPDGDSAWDYYSRLRISVAPSINDLLRNRLIVAMGNRAQRTILKYLRGGDTRWRAENFEEGALLIGRVRQLFKTTPLFESQQSFFQGRALIERGQYPQAVQELQRAVALDAEASHAHNAIGLAYWKQNLLDRAIPSLQQAIALSPLWAYPRNTLALIYLEQRRYDESERMFQSSIEADGEDSAAYRGLGQLYLLLGRLAEAEPQIQHAIEFNPGNAYAYETLGRLRQSQRRYAEAEQAYRLAIRLEPEETSFQIGLAELMAQTNRPQEAGQIFQRIAASGLNSFETVQAYARFLVDQQRYSDAEAVYQQALKLSPGDVNLLVTYGEFLLERGRVRDAERPLRKARQTAPDNAFVHYAFALLSLGQRNPGEAEKELSLSSKADPRLAAPHRLLGDIRSAQKRHGEALAAYRKALDLTIDANQQQKLREQIGAVETAYIREEIGRAERLVAEGKRRDAWTVYTAALASAPDSRDLRNSILQFYAQASPDADLSKLPPAALSDVLRTGFWSRQQQAEDAWQKGQRVQALRAFVGAFDEIGAADLRALGSTAFNIGNESQGLHQIVYRWCLRMLEEKDCAGALDLAGSAVRRRIFAVIPDYRPLTMDSLMSRPDVPDPKTIADYDIAHHPDRRAHEIFAAALAGSGKMDEAKQYLVALEQGRPDLSARILMARTLQAVEHWKLAAEVLKEALRETKLFDKSTSLAEAFVLLGEIQCRSGDCTAARRTLEEGQEALPGNKLIEAALRRLKIP